MNNHKLCGHENFAENCGVCLDVKFSKANEKKEKQCSCSYGSGLAKNCQQCIENGWAGGCGHEYYGDDIKNCPYCDFCECIACVSIRKSRYG